MGSGVWLVISMIAIPAAAVVGVRSVKRLISTMRAALVVVVPLSPRQDIVLPAAGAYELWGEGRRLTRVFRGIDFQLSGPGGGAVPLSRVLVRTTVSGTSSVRVKLRRFSVERGGSYALSISGLPANPDDQARVRVARATAPEFFAHLLGVIGGGLLLIAAVVVLLLAASGAI